MTQVVLAKMTDANLTDEQRRVLAGVLFEMLGGLTERDQKVWRGLWRELMAAGSGQVFSLEFSIIRDGIFHRRHMKLETRLFESQEAYWSFNQFRNWLKVGAGFCDWKVVRGQFVPVPKSISYAECDQATMEEFHNDAIAFLRTRRAQQELWPHLSADKAQEMVETILARFHE